MAEFSEPSEPAELEELPVELAELADGNLDEKLINKIVDVDSRLTGAEEELTRLKRHVENLEIYLGATLGLAAGAVLFLSSVIAFGSKK